MAIIRMVVDKKGVVKHANRWQMGYRIRDVEVAPDGALWMLEDSASGGVYRLTPIEPPPLKKLGGFFGALRDLWGKMSKWFV